MQLHKLSVYLDIDELDIFCRIKKFQHDLFKFLKETESNQNTSDVIFNDKDIKIVTEIAKNCFVNNVLVDNDSLLEIILLYYSIMEIIHEQHTTSTLENFFCIDNFTEILVTNIDYFSKPYMNKLLV